MDPRSSVDKGDMRKTDDRGHLIADRFNGSGGIENLVPMDSDLNQHGDYMKMENTLPCNFPIILQNIHAITL